MGEKLNDAYTFLVRLKDFVLKVTSYVFPYKFSPDKLKAKTENIKGTKQIGQLFPFFSILRHSLIFLALDI